MEKTKLTDLVKKPLETVRELTVSDAWTFCLFTGGALFLLRLCMGRWIWQPEVHPIFPSDEGDAIIGARLGFCPSARIGEHPIENFRMMDAHSHESINLLAIH